MVSDNSLEPHCFVSLIKDVTLYNDTLHSIKSFFQKLRHAVQYTSVSKSMSKFYQPLAILHTILSFILSSCQQTRTRMDIPQSSASTTSITMPLQTS